MKQEQSARRAFVASISAALAAVGLGRTTVHAQQSAATAFHPARHKEDEWLDAAVGKHRVFLDVAWANRGADAIRFASNIYLINGNAYQLGDRDHALVMCLRHEATVYAFDDAMWAKYGKLWGPALHITDPKTGQAPTVNPLMAGLSDLVKKGAAFAVCNQSTRGRSRAAAEATSADPETVYKEWTAHMIPNSRLVPAGVVAATRAQEYGYALLVA